MRKSLAFLGAQQRMGQAGMTLMEIMVVLLIISLVMGALGFGVFQYLKDAKKKTAQMMVDGVAQQMSLELGENPNKNPEEILEDLVGDKKISSDRDPWGTKLRVETEGEDVCVVSAGPDKRFDTHDDIVNKACRKDKE